MQHKNRESMDKDRIEGAAEQGEQTRDCEALVNKTKWRRSGDCARSYLGSTKRQARVMKREHRVSAADAMLTRKNQQQAWKRVKANKGVGRSGCSGQFMVTRASETVKKSV